MVDRVFCNDEFGFVVVVAARIQVAVPTWEIGARVLQPDPMTRTEIVACDVQIQADPIDLAGAHAQVQIKVSFYKVSGGDLGTLFGGVKVRCKTFHTIGKPQNHRRESFILGKIDQELLNDFNGLSSRDQNAQRSFSAKLQLRVVQTAYRGLPPNKVSKVLP